MATKRKRSVSPTANPNECYTEESPNLQSDEASGYEQLRDQRIKENRERMQKMGILDLSVKVKSLNPHKRTPRRSIDRKTAQFPSPLLREGLVRRSSRLQNAPPVTYAEVTLSKKDKALEEKGIVMEEGAKPEIYTEEHEKLLGSTEKSWELFKDGYAADGSRIYDPIKGKTCHQCRQKTLGHRTECCKCRIGRGQFCGDCLFMRYGEHVLEAKQNPNWVCPPCRGICNCSFCRQHRGWPPTGTLYRRVDSLGYKSVAHYLIQTKRAPSESEKNAATPASVKRSLAFTGREAASDKNGAHNFVDGRILEYEEEKAGESEDKKDEEFLTDKQVSSRVKDGQHGQDLVCNVKEDEEVMCEKDMDKKAKTVVCSKTEKDEESSDPNCKDVEAINEPDGSSALTAIPVAVQALVVHVEGRITRSKSASKCNQPGSVAGRTRSKYKVGEIQMVSPCII